MTCFSLFAAAVTLLLAPPVQAAETIALKASDGLAVTADVYRTNLTPGAPWIVLAHQAGSSRGEYLKIAPRLNRLGFNAIALDQRSGKIFAALVNETAKRAVALGKGTTYIDAIPDIGAGIAWARAQTKGPVLLVGSSYSAALAVVLAGRDGALVDGILAFSPGEYLQGQRVVDRAGNIKVPTLLVAPPSEAGRIAPFIRAIPSNLVTSFVPKTGGRHGASSLIAARSDNTEAHWLVVERFLVQFRKQ